MAPPRAHIMRTLRLQLKSGFRRREPPEYKFMKRYPPLSRDTKPRFHELDYKNIPYLELFKKAMARSPVYNERVYPAYWQQEPQALKLAKKQFEHMQNGDDEETAFRKAELYVDELENQSYLDLKALHEALAEMGAKAPFMSDSKLMEEIDSWKQKLQDSPYSELELADQGEIDFLVQTKLMGWDEVQRARRMKDPIFVMQFEQLRSLVFPDKAELEAAKAAEKSRSYKETYCKLHDLNYSLLTTAAPFYIEDYLHYFEALRAQPDLRKWSNADCETLSAWIVDTLAMREVVERAPNHKVQTYLDAIKAQFFPMLRTDASKLPTPTVDSIRRLLYENQVGYKAQESKVYVRRFYRIPALLFPKETFTATLMADRAKLEALTEDDDDDAALLREMQQAGVDEASMPELKAQLQEYVKRLNISMPKYRTGGSDSLDMSALDSILKDAFDEEDEPKREEDSDSSSSDSDSDSDSESDEEALAQGEDGYYTHEEWAAIVAKYKKPALTQLEQERDRVYGLFEFEVVEHAEDETDLATFQQMRLENEIIARARMEKKFNDKEAARRRREWTRRGVWMNELPMANLPLFGGH
ncbi:hypothetical protein B484DRAFT_403134 [Ochromonadaceae sp. CCMP2298]|nr:hypothetical protein B484DRAFT_403134 [Ochromonadaceae sp. CCMP2298]|mmetsp:Transcript_28718/g.63769  ORF Transcript_28718/g.63769 Transcript_28718/m.63769 type:complete len:586 (-) Transcript_28718:208-1965(-)